MADGTGRNDLSIYDEAAEVWWSDEIRWVRVLRNMVPGRLSWFDRFIDWQGKRVLDLGCGGGFMAEALARRGAEVTGIDPADKAIGAARKHAAEEGLQIRYETGVGEDLPFDAGAFDAVVSVDVLEHVRDLDRVMAEVARVLTPSGRFFFDTINRNPVARFGAITVAEDMLRVLPKGTHDPRMFITPDELRAALRGAGMTPRDFTGLGPRGIDRRGDPTFGRIPTMAVIYMGWAEAPGPGAAGDDAGGDAAGAGRDH